jgi:hypothetical protein
MQIQIIAFKKAESIPPFKFRESMKASDINTGKMIGEQRHQPELESTARGKRTKQNRPRNDTLVFLHKPLALPPFITGWMATRPRVPLTDAATCPASYPLNRRNGLACCRRNLPHVVEAASNMTTLDSVWARRLACHRLGWGCRCVVVRVRACVLFFPLSFSWRFAGARRHHGNISWHLRSTTKEERDGVNREDEEIVRGVMARGLKRRRCWASFEMAHN